LEWILFYYRFIITSPSNLDTVKSVAKDLKDQVQGVICEAPGCITPSSLLASPTDVWPQLLAMPFNVKEDVATLPYSSGTTGLPKGVMITHYNIVANLSQLGHPGMFPKALLPEDSVVMAVIPFYHVYGMVGVLMLALSSGYKLVVMEKFHPRDFLATIEKYKVQQLPVVPSLVVFLTKSELVKEYDLSSLTTVSFGAAPLSAEADAEFQQRFPAIPNVRQGFGMTETTVSALNQGLTRPIKPGSVGYGIPSTEAKVIDVETGSLLGPNERGELCIRGPQIMKGYWKKPEATKNTIDEFGYLHTGDIAYYDNDGYFYIVDRIKELIKCKGLQVSSAHFLKLSLSI
jgi:4-coumarate--CoA ligase